MNENVLKVFIGYDQVESISWHTMAHSIFSQSSIPVAIIPVALSTLGGIYKRSREETQSNEFSFSRFLVPFLSGYSGKAVFFDCDQMLRTDIAELLNVFEDEPGKAVYVVKHDYQPRDEIKYLGTRQYSYPRKNWSSVVLWDCEHPANRKVTPEYVNTATPKELHRFLWLNDAEIGTLDIRWNWLVGEYDNPPDDVKNVHWTVGGPYFNEYSHVDFNEEWALMKKNINFCQQIKKS